MLKKISKRVLYFSLLAALLLSFFQPVGARPSDSATPQGQVTSPVIKTPERFGISAPLTTLAELNPVKTGKDTAKDKYTEELREIQRLPLSRLPKPGSSTAPKGVDPVWQKESRGTNIPTPVLTFEGINNIFGVLPPDTNGEVGANHYVQIVNLGFAIWDKEGNLLLGPFFNNALWSGLGGPCDTQNSGDPVVMYDQLADRWFISQFALFAADGNHQCIAVSTSPDPTGTWYQYDYLYDAALVNDYPKFGVWPDGYYMTTNQFICCWAWAGVGAGVFERSAMLMGASNARFVFFDLNTSMPWLWGGMLPSDVDGFPPPRNAPNYFVEVRDDFWGYAFDMLAVFEFVVDWDDPTTSTFTETQTITVPNFDSNLCWYARNCIPQPGGTAVDAISDRLLFRLAYRNYNDHAALVANHTVDVDGADHAGVRWYELQQPTPNVDPGADWSLNQYGTYAPDAEHRWMGSIAMDDSGNMALGYSVSSTSVFPSIRYTGRLAGDPLGTMQAEEEIVAGFGSQSHSSGRWGDYSDMTVDPVDGCTFWYTQEYYGANSNASWQTHVGAFRFDECTSAPSGVLQGTVTDADTSAPLENAMVIAGAYTTLTDTAGFYSFSRLQPGTYDMNVYRYGYEQATASGVVVNAGETTTRDFALNPLPLVTVTGTVTDEETGWPLYASITIFTTGLDPFTIFTNPLDGNYSVDLTEGLPHNFVAEAMLGGYFGETHVVTPSSGGVEDFSLVVDDAICSAPGYAPIEGVGLFTGFEGAFPPSGWTVEDDEGNGVIWDNNVNWGEGNYTGGNGNAATVSSDVAGVVDYDTSLLSPVIPVATLPSTTLEYLANYQNYLNLDFFDLDISVDEGPWTNILSWNEDHGAFRGTPGELVTVDLAAFIAGASSFQLRWHYYDPNDDDWDWYVEIDEVQITGMDYCVPYADGLVVGNVYDANTSEGINSAWVTGDLAQWTTTMTTPEDDALDEGFYTLGSPAGSHDIDATAIGYAGATATVDVVAGSNVWQDFSLVAGILNFDPGSFTVLMAEGESVTQTATIANSGTLDASYEIIEVHGTPPAVGPFHEGKLKVASDRLNERDANHASGFDLPSNVPALTPTVIRSWPTNLDYAWGIGYNLSVNDLWLGNIAVAGGDDKDYRFLPDGTNTGDTIDVSALDGSWAADMAYNMNTGTLWQINVGGDNCIHELDPAGMTLTGNSICPPFPVSQRGLAYDAATDTFFAGSWNDGVIYRFDTSGTIVSAVNTGLPIAGLAYNPYSGILFTQIWTGGTWMDIFALDTNNFYTPIYAYTIPGMLSEAGLEIDCDGDLWSVDQGGQQVFEIDTDEQHVCDFADISWLTVAPTFGTLPPEISESVDVTFNASFLSAGNYLGYLRIDNDTPYGSLFVPVELTVSTYGVDISPDTAAGFGDEEVPVYYTLQVTNLSDALTDAFDVAITGNLWDTSAVSVIGPLGPGESANLVVMVTVPDWAAVDDTDTATISVVSQGNQLVEASAVLTTTKAGMRETYLPIIWR